MTTQLLPTDFIIFGGLGDLARRMILPALFLRHKDQQLPDGRIILLGRDAMSDNEAIATVRQACMDNAPQNAYGDSVMLNQFVERISYKQCDATRRKDYEKLRPYINDDAREQRVFYLATPPDLFEPIAEHLAGAEWVTPQSKLVVEKPLGENLKTFLALDATLKRYFDESQIYRIDHYLGKETVQNLMIIRFANNMFEHIWNKSAVKYVEITVAETLGAAERMKFYNSTGALRDMVQNHLLQLLCLVAMEPPAKISPDSIRDEKVKVLKALRPIDAKTVLNHSIKGQYSGGVIDNATVAGYAQEAGVAETTTETFVALKVLIDNWRWAGVPFYLRTGKRLAKKYSEIVITFQPIPDHLFPGQSEKLQSNKLIIRIQPDETIKLLMMTKKPGPGGYRLNPVYLNLSLADVNGVASSGPYERLLMDVVRGNPTLFMRSDEVAASWQWIDSIRESWQLANQPTLSYPAGSMGPRASASLLLQDHHHWFEH